VRALLYVRVSTDEQARSGFSLGQQLEALRSYCQDHNIEIIAEFEDRASGASLDRPRLDALRDVVSSGGIDLVLTQDRDRLSREPAHIYILREEFLGYGTTLRSLNDRGDDSPEGQLTDGILDQLAKFERAKTMERTRRGKVRKAQEGKIVGSGIAPYGFYYDDNHYHVDPERMPYVHEMFERVAAGESLYSIVQHLTEIGAPSPKGKRWHAPTIRKMLLSDTYSGTFYWGKLKVTTTTISKMVNGERTYKKKTVTEQRPQSDWIAIPVPDSGVPPETIARARENLNGNIKAASKNSGRVWELSGGVGTCSACGKRMGASTSINSVGKRYYYYRCSSRDIHTCSNRKHYRAEELEMQVNDAIVETFQPETWEGFVDDLCDIKLANLHCRYRTDPKEIREKLAKRVVSLQTKISRASDLFIDGHLSRPDYEERKTTLQDEIESVQTELSKVTDLDDEIKRVEDLRRTLKGIENPLSGHYALTEFPKSYNLGDIDEIHSLGYGSKETAAKRRQNFYRQVGMKVKVGENLEISLGLGAVCKTVTASRS
jgi:site-specific DNA recombinase